MLPPVILPVIDLPADHAAVPRLTAKLPGRGKLSIVPRQPRGPAGACYWNVERCVKLFGGRRRNGWMLQLVPSVYAYAMHHAIWEKADGTRLDVTLPQTARQGDTTFVEDPVTRVDLRYPVGIENIHVSLVDDPDVEGALKAYRANNKLMQRITAMLKAAGYRWTISDGWEGKADMTAQKARTEPQLAATYADLHRLNAIILQRYFSAPD